MGCGDKCFASFFLNAAVAPFQKTFGGQKMPGVFDYRLLGNTENMSWMADQAPRKIRTEDQGFSVLLEDCRFTRDKAVSDFRYFSINGDTGEYHLRESILPESLESEDDYLHQQDFFDMRIVLQGQMEVNIESEYRLLPKGSAIIVSPSVRHNEYRIGKQWFAAFLRISRKTAASLAADLRPYGFADDLADFFTRGNEEDNRFYKNYLEFRPEETLLPDESRESSTAYLHQIVHEISSRQPGYQQMVYVLLLRLFSTLMDHKIYRFRDFHLDYSMSDYMLEQVRSYLESHNGAPDFRELEAELHYNADYINRVIKQKTGLTLTEFGQDCRIRRAARLLEETDFSVNRLCREMGFENKTHFYKLFQNAYHMTPNEYRSRIHETAGQ